MNENNNRKKLMAGIVEAEHPAVACITTKSAGVLMIIDASIGSAIAKDFESIAALIQKSTDDWMQVTTFNMLGARANTQHLFRAFISLSDVVHVSEFTEKMFDKFIHDVNTRATAAAMGPSGVPNIG